MIGIDAQAEALLRRGSPHLRVLQDGLPDDREAAAWAKKALQAFDPNIYGVVWPREVAIRFCRGMGAARKRDPEATDVNIEFPDIDDAVARMAVAGPINETEARAIVAHVTHFQSIHKERAIEDLLFLLEAMVGAEPVLDAALSRYEEMGDDAYLFHNPHDVTSVAFWCGCLLERLGIDDVTAHSRHRARIEHIVRTRPHDSYVRREWVKVLGDIDACEAAGIKRFPANLLYCSADAIKDACFEYGVGGSFDLALAARAGPHHEAVMGVFATHLGKAWAYRKPFIIDELALFASPLATEMLQVLAKAKRTQKKATAALQARNIVVASHL